jgi:hypothetical protein
VLSATWLAGAELSRASCLTIDSPLPIRDRAVLVELATSRIFESRFLASRLRCCSSSPGNSGRWRRQTWMGEARIQLYIKSICYSFKIVNLRREPCIPSFQGPWGPGSHNSARGTSA